MSIVAKDIGLSRNDADSTFDLLPKRIQNTLAFFDTLSKIWRYDYGVPHILRHGTIIGAHQFPIVSVLLRGTILVHKFLPEDKFSEFCRRLENRSKHFDFLSEFDPIIRLGQGFQIKYEPSGYAKRNRKIDWLISFDDGSSCLIDVKNRIRPIIKLGEALTGSPSKKAIRLKDAESAEGIFKNSEIKFLPQRQNIPQGLWIRIDIFIDRDELQSLFDSLDRALVQFAVLTNFAGDARILARDPGIKNWVRHKFNLKEAQNPSFLQS